MPEGGVHQRLGVRDQVTESGGGGLSAVGVPPVTRPGRLLADGTAIGRPGGQDTRHAETQDAHATASTAGMATMKPPQNAATIFVAKRRAPLLLGDGGGDARSWPGAAVAGAGPLRR